MTDSVWIQIVATLLTGLGTLVIVANYMSRMFNRTMADRLANERRHAEHEQAIKLMQQQLTSLVEYTRELKNEVSTLNRILERIEINQTKHDE